MRVEVRLADKNNANIIKNIYPLYLYDLSEIHGNVPNKYGIYEDDEIKTLMEQYDIQQIWFEKPDELFLFTICRYLLCFLFFSSFQCEYV